MNTYHSMTNQLLLFREKIIVMGVLIICIIIGAIEHYNQNTFYTLSPLINALQEQNQILSIEIEKDRMNMYTYSLFLSNIQKDFDDLRNVEYHRSNLEQAKNVIKIITGKYELARDMFFKDNSFKNEHEIIYYIRFWTNIINLLRNSEPIMVNTSLKHPRNK